MRRFSLILAFLVLTPLALVGCDDAGGGPGGNTFTQTIRDVQFTFSVVGSDLIGGATVDATATQDVLTQLTGGFTGADIVSARVVSGSSQINLLLPASGTDIDVLESATLSLFSGNSNVTVASQDDFASMTSTMSASAQLDANSNNISNVLANGPFRGRLVLDADDARISANTTYRFEVLFDVAVEVPGI